MINAALVGAGMAGGELARQLASQPDVRLCAVVDISRDAATRFANTHGGTPYTSVTQMVGVEKPQIVIVASSNDAHADNTIEAIEAGVRNVFCEKPLAIDLDDAERMVEVAERYGVRTSLGFAGMEPATLRLIELVQSGKLGRVLHAYYHTHRGYGFWGQERVNTRGTRSHHAAVVHPDRSGGWVIHHACHMIFVLCRIAGTVNSVFGQLTTSTSEAASEEIVDATLRFASGATGVVLDSIGSFRGTRIGVIGTRGTALLQDDMAKRPGAAAEIRCRMEGADDDQVESFAFQPNHPTRLLEFIDAVRHDRPSPIPFAEALANLQICHAIREADASAGKVELPPVALQAVR